MKIREIVEKDIRDIEDIARRTWEGEDYLPRVFARWVKEGDFYGIEVDGKVIATGKITLLPGKVGWLEGLRVHPSYRGSGYGRVMHEFLLEKAKDLKERGIIQFLEYSTYFTNEASIHLGLKSGFKIVQRYYGMDYSTSSKNEPKKIRLESVEEFGYEDYIPCGWKFIRRIPESLDYLRDKCQVLEFKNYKFMILKNNPEEVTPFVPTPEYVKEILPAISYFSPSGVASIRVPENEDLHRYESLGFKKWEETEEPEILLLNKKL